MNEIAARILDTKCKTCRAKVERGIYEPPFGIGKNKVKWRCTNQDCEQHYWHLPERPVE